MESVSLKNAAVAYPSTPGSVVLDGLCAEIPLCSHTLVLGGNGSGKTALARLLAGLDSPTAGSILWPEGKEEEQISKSAHLLRSGVVFEQPEFQFQGFSVREELCAGLLYHGVESSRAEELAGTAAASYGIEDLLENTLHSLCYSAKLAVLVSSFLLLRPRLLVLDFSLAELDREFLKRLFSVCMEKKSPALVVLSRRAEDYFLMENAGVYVLNSGNMDKLAADRDVPSTLQLLRDAGIAMPTESSPPG
jgi:energy-coupling factor transporter ATP-binding protein EcfA2